MPNHPKRTDEHGNLWCPGCLKFLPKTDFPVWNASFHGVQSRCRPCLKEMRHRTKEKPRAFLLATINRLKHSHIASDLPSEWAIKQYEKQKGLCYYTGLPMTFTQGEGQVWTNASIDRIDSGGSYTAGNCVLCCHGFNFIKSHLSVETTYKFCQHFVKYYKDLNRW